MLLASNSWKQDGELICYDPTTRGFILSALPGLHIIYPDCAKLLVWVTWKQWMPVYWAVTLVIEPSLFTWHHHPALTLNTLLWHLTPCFDTQKCSSLPVYYIAAYDNLIWSIFLPENWHSFQGKWSWIVLIYTLSESWIRSYFEALDTVTSCINERFEQEGYNKLEQLIKGVRMMRY